MMSRYKNIRGAGWLGAGDNGLEGVHAGFKAPHSNAAERCLQASKNRSLELGKLGLARGGSEVSMVKVH